jgi:hypothetical protein
MKLEHSLVLNRWLHAQLGAREIADLKDDLAQPEPAAPGESPFLSALLERRGVRLDEADLRAYDGRIREYEQRLSEARGGFAWKYFQYLALLYTEVYLDRLTRGPGVLLAELNAFIEELRGREPHLARFPDFRAEDLRRLAYFMATGSGKTLLLHANLWQVHHYLEHGRHPEALVRRADGRREFDNVLLITPNEGLSEQHIAELRQSGIDAVHLAYEEPSGWLFGPQVRVIEISKLAEEPSGDGLSIALDELGSRNLVFVDEGHKGVGSDAQVWKSRQQRLSQDGLLLEYSATFAQAVAAASKRAQGELRAEYGKAIVFDYSYRHFHGDRYGKEFEVLNLEAERAEKTDELLLGGLLTYYQQLRLFGAHRAEYRPFNIEKPLWVFLGSKVIRSGKQDLGDVARVVAFLKRFLEDEDWAVEWIGKVLAGESGFRDEETRKDLFAPRLEHLRGEEPRELYGRIADAVFHGRGALEVWELKRTDSELGLKVSSGRREAGGYFGVVNVGDPGALRRHLESDLGIEVPADELTDSLFQQVDRPEPAVNVLVGAKKFIEGWSSWRVSTMGLLNIGRGEGPQVIQLFGRGVRLKGRGWSLQRSTRRGERDEDLPPGLEHLETLYVFGWNATYVKSFREMIEAEELEWEVEIPLTLRFDTPPALYVPRPREGYRVEQETWTLAFEQHGLFLDLTPRVTAMVGSEVHAGTAGHTVTLNFGDAGTRALLDLDALYADLLDYKRRRGRFANLYLDRAAILPILRDSTLRLLESDARNPEVVQEGALRVLQAYLDRFAGRREREAQSRHLEPRRLTVHEEARHPYVVRGTDPELRRQLLDLVGDPARLLRSADEPLPRLYVDRHLFNPVLLDPEENGAPGLSVTPAGLKESERDFVKDLMQFWESHRQEERFAGTTLHLLRNPPHRGVGFFQRSSFFPDFILWLRNEAQNRTRILFVEPHGMHHHGLGYPNRGKIEALKTLEEISLEPAFQDQGIEMGGYILTRTRREDIPSAEELTWEELAAEHRVLHQAGDEYVGRLLG